ncbi:hypothetical protein BB559_005477 [Furculomyces boomerangus]|uniref:ARM repeat-containing protein n=1 Tax=Furculomyces boomerangus TaxID=61424 RepID=A0A2T9Y8L4_9FUNG|nr:hypothetical protein BB559_005477 [Furculomyces boomerangus]
MGKAAASKASKSRKVRLNASSNLGVPVNTNLLQIVSDSNLQNSDPKTSNPESGTPVVLKKLESIQVNERVWAVASLGQLLTSKDTNTIKLLLKHEAVGKLVKTLLDADQEVVLESTGALRNLVGAEEFFIGGEEKPSENSLFDLRLVSEQLFSNLSFIVKKLEPILKQSVEQLKLSKTNTTPSDQNRMNISEQRVLFGIFENIFLLIQTLCQNYTSGIHLANNLKVLPAFVYIITNSSYFSSSLVYAAGSCLYTMSESNKPLEIDFLQNDNNLEMANALLNTLGNNKTACLEENTKSSKDNSQSEKSGLFVRILAGATLSNLQKSKLFIESQSKNEPKWDDGSVNRVLLEVISGFIQYNIQSKVTEAISLVNIISNTKNIARKDNTTNNQLETNIDSIKNNDDFSGIVEFNIAKLDSILNNTSNIQLALELAANIFSEEGLEVSYENEPDNLDELEEDGFDELDMAEVLGSDGTMAQSVWNEAEPVIKVFVNNIVPALLNLINPCEELVELQKKVGLVMKAGPTAENSINQNNIDELLLAESVVVAFLNISSAAFACFNNFLSVVEQEYQQFTSSNTSSIDKNSQKYHLINNIPSWWLSVLQSTAICYKTIEFGNNSCNDNTNIRPSPFGQQMYQVYNTLHLSWCEVMERSLSCLWTMSRFALVLVRLDEDTINGFIGIYNLDGIPPSLKTACVGILGKIAQLQPGQIGLNKIVGNFLVTNVIQLNLTNLGKDVLENTNKKKLMENSFSKDPKCL